MIQRGRNPMVFLAATSLLAGAALALACSDSGRITGPPEQITELPRPLTSLEAGLVARSNTFGLQLLREVDSRRRADQPNTVISPLSASMSLGMAMEGADGGTYEAMRDVLGFQGMDREEVSTSWGTLTDLLLTLDPAVEILLANSAWSRQGFPFNQSYLDAVTTRFDATVQELDFQSPAALSTINGWVSDNTNGLIETILDEISPDEILFLINALYFKGDWTTQFKKASTAWSGFLLENGSSVNVETMSGEIPYTGIRQFVGGRTVGELPYGGQAFGLVVVLPGPGETVDDLLADMDDVTWNEWTWELPTEKVSVHMPRFELEWGDSLAPSLKAMGMEVAFDETMADFSRMSPRDDLYLTRVDQKTYMRVDEEGTEAAAVTSTGTGVTSAPPSLVVDRPFLLAIRERLSGTILFLGAMRDPRVNPGS